MSIRSRKQILDEAANAEGASNEAILMAALNESQEEYKRLSDKLLLAFESYDKRIEALEAAVRASNEQRGIDVQLALKNAAEAILGDVRGKAGEYIAAVEVATAKLQTAKTEKARDDRWETIKGVFLAFAVIVAAFYAALLLYGWWYDIPEAWGKLDAINNGIWQILNRP